MRIVDREAFLQLPAGTLFAKYEPISFGPLLIKGDTSSADFWVQDLLPWPEGVDDSLQYFDAMEKVAAGGASGPLDFNCEARDGLFDHDQLFAVLDRSDVEALIERLGQALYDGYRDPAEAEPIN
ncbi:hypothetical protein [Roseisolibacter sp. H3M3-2]|uniref:hypothetical protein n=1 Tax=Roseisolibacter sp. H3M3-2 TaxID=3031323 RepID=UPI0023DC721F|nr:hypothetical protein [Roseisolibacter sp. H3M3-2]MDF1505786.1 hypothetical protein [Roseisolibacter sp. H3M3-2]